MNAFYMSMSARKTSPISEVEQSPWAGFAKVPVTGAKSQKVGFDILLFCNFGG